MRQLTTLFIILHIGLIPFSANAQPDESIVATVYQTVNVREQPGTHFEIIAQLRADERIQINGRAYADSHWVRVLMDDGRAGWIPDYVLIVDDDLTLLPMVNEPTIAAAENEVLLMTYGLVNVRNGPGMRFELVGQLDPNDQFRAVARNNEDNDWLYVQDERLEFSGWVAYFTVLVNGNPNELPVRALDGSGTLLVAPEALIYTTGNVRLHHEPNLDAPVARVLPFESGVIPLARRENWLLVQYGDLTGWAIADLFVIAPERLAELPEHTPETQYQLAEDGSVTVVPAATDEPAP